MAALAASTSALGGDAQPVTVIARPRAIAPNLIMTRMMCFSPSSVGLTVFPSGCPEQADITPVRACRGKFFRHGPFGTSKPEAVEAQGVESTGTGHPQQLRWPLSTGRPRHRIR